MRIKIDVSDGKNIFFISDLHLGHRNVIKYDKRPFIDASGQPDLSMMHTTIINNWNSVVGHNDVVFNLGDLCFDGVNLAKEIVSKLNGKIHFLIGNHDSYNDLISLNRFETINDLVDLNIVGNTMYKNLHFVLCHYPIYSWNRMKHKSYHIHGHLHGNLDNDSLSDNYYVGKKVIDVGCNLIDYKPISYTEIINKLK
jgi:calcineurin-like phosphoesterase family protein